MFGLLSKGSLVSMAGIDFGSQTIKAVTISGRPGKVHLGSVAEIPMPKGTLVDYQLQDIERVGQSLKSLKRLIQGDCQLVATAVTGSNVITKVIQVDANINENELENQVHLEAEQLIPFPLDEVSLDFEILGMAGDNGRQEVLLSAALCALAGALLGFVAQHVRTAMDRRQAQVQLERQVERRTLELQRANRSLQDEVFERRRAEKLQAALAAAEAGKSPLLQVKLNELAHVAG